MKGFLYGIAFMAVSSFLTLDMADVFIIYRGDDIPPDEQLRVMMRTSYMFLVVSAIFIAFSFYKRNLVDLFFRKVLPELPMEGFKVINLSWIITFFGMAAINFYMLSHFTFDAWVMWKLFGVIGIMLVFISGQLLYASNLIKKSSENNGDAKEEA